jgi:hypothetical protein
VPLVSRCRITVEVTPSGQVLVDVATPPPAGGGRAGRPAARAVETRPRETPAAPADPGAVRLSQFELRALDFVRRNRRRGRTPKSLAAALGVKVRRVQMALKRLRELGLLDAGPAGTRRPDAPGAPEGGPAR